jgi:hypothetical protein
MRISGCDSTRIEASVLCFLEPGYDSLVVAGSSGLCLVVASSLWFVIIPKSKDRFMERPPLKTVQP